MTDEELIYLANSHNEFYNRETGEYEEFEPKKVELPPIQFR